MQYVKTPKIIVLVEQKKGCSAMLITSWRAPSKWLSEEIGVSPSTVSKWCTNSSQPDMETLARISKLLNVSIEDLYNQRFIKSM
jgi:transcriptional regulator with XRE-family HTH domain